MANQARQKQIMDFLTAYGTVSVHRLSQELYASEATIRRDLEALSRQGKLRRIFGGDPERRMYCLLDYSAHPRDIADPWYTGDFDATYADVCEGCGALLEHLLRGGLRPE